MLGTDFSVMEQQAVRDAHVPGRDARPLPGALKNAEDEPTMNTADLRVQTLGGRLGGSTHTTSRAGKGLQGR
jgi:hypothetical protein